MQCPPPLSAHYLPSLRHYLKQKTFTFGSATQIVRHPGPILHLHFQIGNGFPLYPTWLAAGDLDLIVAGYNGFDQRFQLLELTNELSLHFDAHGPPSFAVSCYPLPSLQALRQVAVEWRQKKSVEEITVSRGVYALWAQGKLLYVGMGRGVRGVRQRVEAHRRLPIDAVTAIPTYDLPPDLIERIMIRHYKPLWNGVFRKKARVAPLVLQ